jgi:hypothetical protein
VGGEGIGVSGVAATNQKESVSGGITLNYAVS